MERNRVAFSESGELARGGVVVDGIRIQVGVELGAEHRVPGQVRMARDVAFEDVNNDFQFGKIQGDVDVLVHDVR